MKLTTLPKGANLAPNPETSALGITLRIDALSPVQVVQWLEAAVPQYEAMRGQMAKAALAIGYALIVVRDFGERGSLAKLKKMHAFGRSERTLKRCVALAQKFLVATDRIDPKSHKLANASDVTGFFQSEFDFNNAAPDSILSAMSEWAGDSSITELMEAEEFGPEDNTPPAGGKSAKNKFLGGKAPLQTPEELLRQAFQEAFKEFQEEFASLSWHQLYDEDLTQLETYLETTWRTVAAENKLRAESKRRRR